jgi:hypothetical protein
MIRRQSITSAMFLAANAAAETVRRTRSGTPAPPPPDSANGGPPTDAGRWQAQHLEALSRQPLYTIAATRGVPERRLAHMSREDILEMLLGRDRRPTPG